MKYASGKLKTPASTPSSTQLTKIKHIDSHLVPDLVGTPEAQKPSILAHVSKVIGRKALAYELGISDSLLDQMLTGQKNDPVIRIKRLVKVAVKFCGPEPALEIAQDLVAEVNGQVLSETQFHALRVLAQVLTK